MVHRRAASSLESDGCERAHVQASISVLVTKERLNARQPENAHECQLHSTRSTNSRLPLERKPTLFEIFLCILLLAAWVLLNLQRQRLLLLFDPLRLSLYPFCCGGATHFFRCIGDTTSSLERGHCACVKTGRGDISAEFAVLTLTAHELGGREAAFSCQLEVRTTLFTV